jgi:hypothetical protein
MFSWVWTRARSWGLVATAAGAVRERSQLFAMKKSHLSPKRAENP